MCQSPSTLPDGTTFACRKCPQCRDLYIDDWEGRNIAESKSATGTFAVTLTYGRVDGEVHHAHSVALFYSDLQKYMKILRHHGYVVRYFVAGEFGGLKGRTHWHVILHFYGAIPPHKYDVDFMHEAVKANGKPALTKSGEPTYFWPHGWSHWKRAHSGTVRYNAKYALKDINDTENQSLLQMTKNPPLGAIYFKEMARSAARQGVALHDASYCFSNVRYKKGKNAGKRKQYRLRGRSEQIFVQTYIEEYWRVHGKEPPDTLYMQTWDKGWKRELRRIAERAKERVGKWSVKDHFNHATDFRRRLEIEQEQRELADKTAFELPPQKKRRAPRDHDEWKTQFEKEWLIYGKTHYGQAQPEQANELEHKFERAWQRQADQREEWLRQQWQSKEWDSREQFDDYIREYDKQAAKSQLRGIRRNGTSR